MKNTNFLKGDRPDIAKLNMKSLKSQGKSELEATKMTMGKGSKAHPNRHKNLGAFLHKGKGKMKPVDKPEYPGDKEDK